MLSLVNNGEINVEYWPLYCLTQWFLPKVDAEALIKFTMIQMPAKEVEGAGRLDAGALTLPPPLTLLLGALL
jgi:hypothetical protein